MADSAAQRKRRSSSLDALLLPLWSICGAANPRGCCICCWTALTRFAGDGQLSVDNNWIENQIRPIAIGRANWLFAGSLRAGQRAAAVMSLVQSARMNGHDPYAYLKDVLTRLPTHSASQVEELLPHRWQPAST